MLNGEGERKSAPPGVADRVRGPFVNLPKSAAHTRRFPYRR
jgi:hypothetical protein